MLGLSISQLENKYWTKHLSLFGVDEVGRGSFAGPVVAAAVSFPSNHVHIPGINDSKKLSPPKRQHLFYKIISTANTSIATVGLDTINSVGIGCATQLAINQALQNIDYDHVVIDGRDHPDPSNQKIQTLIKADAKIYSVAAASIVAKVYRDQLMTIHHHQYPQYDWINNKGYGTLKHRQGIIKYGPTKLHRTAFIAKTLSKKHI